MAGHGIFPRRGGEFSIKTSYHRICSTVYSFVHMEFVLDLPMLGKYTAFLEPVILSCFNSRYGVPVILFIKNFKDMEEAANTHFLPTRSGLDKGNSGV